MKKTFIAVFAITISITTVALGAELAAIQWNRSNSEALRAFDKTAVEGFVNELRGNDPLHVNIGEFAWADLARDKQLQLVATEDLSGRLFFDYLAVYQRDQSGKVAYQWLSGSGIRDLSKVIRDLNGDGKDELVIPTTLASKDSGIWLPTSRTPTWPAVYRLKDGKYVEASGDFPGFYNTDVLPQLDKEIGRARRLAVKSGYQGNVAALVLEKDKILRVIGRDPTAGLKQAYRWMKSDDPQLLQCAIATFDDIGGHEEELRTASAALKPAIQREMAAHGGG